MRDAWSDIMDARHAARLGRLGYVIRVAMERNTMDYMVYYTVYFFIKGIASSSNADTIVLRDDIVSSIRHALSCILVFCQCTIELRLYRSKNLFIYRKRNFDVKLTRVLLFTGGKKFSRKK